MGAVRSIVVSERREKPWRLTSSAVCQEEVNGQMLDDPAIIGLVMAVILAGRPRPPAASAISFIVWQRILHCSSFLRENTDPHRPMRWRKCLRIESPQQENAA